MAQRVKTTNQATSEGVIGVLVMGFVLIAFLIPTVGYIIYLRLTPFKLKKFKDYGVNIKKIKQLKIISVILSLVSILSVFIIANNKDIQLSLGITPTAIETVFVYSAIGALVVSLLFLTYAIITTKEELDGIKQVKKFFIEYDEIINKKEAILQQAVSLYNRNTEKYNSVLEDEIKDVVQKVQQKFNFPEIVLKKIYTDTKNILEEI